MSRTCPGWHSTCRKPSSGLTSHYEDGVGTRLAHQQLVEGVLVQLDQAAPTARKRLQTRDLQ